MSTCECTATGLPRIVNPTQTRNTKTRTTPRRRPRLRRPRISRRRDLAPERPHGASLQANCPRTPVPRKRTEGSLRFHDRPQTFQRPSTSRTSRRLSSRAACLRLGLSVRQRGRLPSRDRSRYLLSLAASKGQTPRGWGTETRTTRHRHSDECGRLARVTVPDGCSYRRLQTPTRLHLSRRGNWRLHVRKAACLENQKDVSRLVPRFPGLARGYHSYCIHLVRPAPHLSLRAKSARRLGAVPAVASGSPGRLLRGDCLHAT